MSSRSLRVELSPSPRLASLLVAAHGAAGVAVLIVTPSLVGGMIALLLTALGVASAWRVALLRSNASVRAIRCEGTALHLELASGASVAAEAAKRRYVSRLLLALPLARPRWRTLLVTADMLPPAAFRRLRLWALWGKLPDVAGPQPGA